MNLQVGISIVMENKARRNRRSAESTSSTGTGQWSPDDSDFHDFELEMSISRLDCLNLIKKIQLHMLNNGFVTAWNSPSFKRREIDFLDS